MVILEKGLNMLRVQDKVRDFQVYAYDYKENFLITFVTLIFKDKEAYLQN